jgi:hypothetical protein
VSGEREQNWYPTGEVGWFTQHIREGIEVTAEQVRLLQPARPSPTGRAGKTVGGNSAGVSSLSPVAVSLWVKG